MPAKCEHGKQRCLCKQCKSLGIGGSYICDHGRRRDECRNCCGALICEHGKRKRTCVDCGTSATCGHKRRRVVCKDCKALSVGGTGLCIHDRAKSQCQKCKALGVGGASICEHHRSRRLCRECKGSGICPHSKIRYECSRCEPEDVYNSYKRNARSRGLSFELTFEEFKWLIENPCPMCGEANEPMGVDRVNSAYGYRFDNTQSMCSACNWMKSDHSEEEFDNHIMKIIKHRPELSHGSGTVGKEHGAVSS